MVDIPQNNVGIESPRPFSAVAENQTRWQWVNNNDFYSMMPAPYYSFYNNWVRLWLYWYDGFVPWVHGTSNGLLSTKIGTTIVNRSADIVFGGNLMFSNARKPIERVDTGDGKSIGKALDFISNIWSKKVGLKSRIKRGIRDAFAGGFSLLKLNKQGGDIWLDGLRADRFYIDKTGQGDIRKCVSVLSFYDQMTSKDNPKRYCLVEERRYEKIGLFNEEIPVVEYKMYEANTQIQYFTTARENFIKYEQLPKSVREAYKSEYSFDLNKPQAMNGFNNLGVYLLKGSDDVSNVPQVGLGESLLANILNYLFEFDFYNTCFNTDMYLARGRILLPKYMQSPNVRQGQAPNNHGLDSFVYTKVESTNPDAMKPEPIQFELRSDKWKEARNILLESMATSIGLSVSTLASYLSDGSNRTAREISAEESATTLFVENNRRRFEKPKR